MCARGEFLEIFTRLVKGGKEVIIDGKLRNYDEYIEIKNQIKDEIIDSTLTLYFINSVVVDSYLLGFILNLKENSGVKINIIVANSRLYEFLQNIDFNKFFDIKIKEYVEWIAGILSTKISIELHLALVAWMSIGMD